MMRRIVHLTATILLLIELLLNLASCKSKQKLNISFYKAINTNLLWTAGEYNNKTKILIDSIRSHYTKSKYKNMEEMISKINSVHDISTQCVSYVNNLKDSLKIMAGFLPEKNILDYRLDDFIVVKEMFEKQGKAVKLQEKLTEFESSLIRSDKNISGLIKANCENCHFYNFDSPQQDQSESSFYNVYFNDLCAIGALVSLNKFLKDISSSENRVIEYYFEKINSNN